MADGKTQSSFTPADKRLFIMTPTHWMRMDHKGEKFDGVFYGTYSQENDTISSVLTYSSHPIEKNVALRQKVEGNRLQIISTGQASDGKPARVYDTF